MAACHLAVTDVVQMMLRNEATGREEKRDITIIINMDASRKIMPSSVGIAALPFQSSPITELTVAVAEPICYEQGMDFWGKSLVPCTPPQLRKQFIQMVESPPWTHAEPFLRRNRGEGEKFQMAGFWPL